MWSKELAVLCVMAAILGYSTILDRFRPFARTMLVIYLGMFALSLVSALVRKR